MTTVTFTSMPSRLDQEALLKSAGAVEGYYGVWTLGGETVGYRDECDRDEERIFYDYFIRADLL